MPILMTRDRKAIFPGKGVLAQPPRIRTVGAELHDQL